MIEGEEERTWQHLEGRIRFALQLLTDVLGDEHVMGSALVGFETLSSGAYGRIKVVLKLDGVRRRVDK